MDDSRESKLLMLEESASGTPEVSSRRKYRAAQNFKSANQRKRRSGHSGLWEQAPGFQSVVLCGIPYSGTGVIPPHPAERT